MHLLIIFIMWMFEITYEGVKKLFGLISFFFKKSTWMALYLFLKKIFLWCVSLISNILKDFAENWKFKEKYAYMKFFFHGLYSISLGRFLSRSSKDMYHMFWPYVYNNGPNNMIYENTFQLGFYGYLKKAWTEHPVETAKTMAYILAYLIFSHFFICSTSTLMSIIFFTGLLMLVFGSSDLLTWITEYEDLNNEWKMFWNIVVWFIMSMILHILWFWFLKKSLLPFLYKEYWPCISSTFLKFMGWLFNTQNTPSAVAHMFPENYFL